MYAMFLTSCIYSIRYLNSPEPIFDIKAEASARVGMMFGLCGLLTGSLWARFTWGTWWTFAEPKMNLAALAMMIYVAYLVLRSAFDDEDKRQKLLCLQYFCGYHYSVFVVCGSAPINKFTSRSRRKSGFFRNYRCRITVNFVSGYAWVYRALILGVRHHASLSKCAV